MILGLDISTSKIGYCILDENEKIIANEFMKLKPLQLEDRAEIFYEFLFVLSKKHNIDHVYIEEPFTMFGGGRTTAGTMAKLQRFNGMCSFAVTPICVVDAKFATPSPLCETVNPAELNFAKLSES